MTKINKSIPYLKNKNRKILQKTIKRSKKRITRRIYYAGNNYMTPLLLDDSDSQTYTTTMQNVLDNDKRIFDCMSSYPDIIIEDSPMLTTLPFFKKPTDYEFSVIIDNCNQLEWMIYNSINKICFQNMYIRKNLLSYRNITGTDKKRDCKNFTFINCTFESGCIMNCITTVGFTSLDLISCNGIPNFASTYLNSLKIRNCKKVHFPELIWPNNIFNINIKRNEYVNDGVKQEFYLAIQHIIHHQSLNPHQHFEISSDIVNNRMVDEFDKFSIYNAWLPPSSAWSPFIPKRVKSDITPNTIIDDFINGQISLQNYIYESDGQRLGENIIFFKMNSDYFVIDLDRIRIEIDKFGMENKVIVYECRLANNDYSDAKSNTVNNKPFFKLAAISYINGIYIPLNQIQHIIQNNDCKFWECYDSGLDEMKSLVSHAVKSGHHKVGGLHCQGKQTGKIFYLRMSTVSRQVGNLISPNYHYCHDNIENHSPTKKKRQL